MGLATSGWRQMVGVDTLGVLMAWKRGQKRALFSTCPCQAWFFCGSKVCSVVSEIQMGC